MINYDEVANDVQEICKDLELRFEGERIPNCIAAMQMQMAQALWLLNDKKDVGVVLEKIVEGIMEYYKQCEERGRRKQ